MVWCAIGRLCRTDRAAAFSRSARSTEVLPEHRREKAHIITAYSDAAMPKIHVALRSRLARL